MLAILKRMRASVSIPAWTLMVECDYYWFWRCSPSPKYLFLAFASFVFNFTFHIIALIKWLYPEPFPRDACLRFLLVHSRLSLHSVFLLLSISAAASLPAQGTFFFPCCVFLHESAPTNNSCGHPAWEPFPCLSWSWRDGSMSFPPQHYQRQ